MMRDKEVIRVLETMAVGSSRYEREAIEQAIEAIKLVKTIRRALKGKHSSSVN